MVGDGLNDAPVLAGADVSLAVADGAALAQRAADLVATHPSLMRIPDAIVLARRTRKIIRQNLTRSEEHTSELQSLMRISYAVFCLKKKKTTSEPTYILI